MVYFQYVPSFGDLKTSTSYSLFSVGCQLWGLLRDGRKVAMQFGGVEVWENSILNPFLPTLAAEGGRKHQITLAY